MSWILLMNSMLCCIPPPELYFYLIGINRLSKGGSFIEGMEDSAIAALKVCGRAICRKY
jgi:hypothetical protein